MMPGMPTQALVNSILLYTQEDRTMALDEGDIRHLLSCLDYEKRAIDNIQAVAGDRDGYARRRARIDEVEALQAKLRTMRDTLKGDAA